MSKKSKKPQNSLQNKQDSRFLRYGPIEDIPISSNPSPLSISSQDLLYLEELNQAQLKNLAIQDPWIFFSEVLLCQPQQSIHYDESYHGGLIREMAGLRKGENFLNLSPRETRKTWLTLGLIVWFIIRDPNIRITIISVSLDRAKKFASMLRKIFTPGSPDYVKFQTLFPEFLLHSGRKNDLNQAQQFTLPSRLTSHIDPTVFSTFMGSSGTGGRGDIFLLDDAWDNKTLSNPEQGQQVLRDFLAIIPLLEGSKLGKYGNLIINCTPWAHYDPPSVIMGRGDFASLGEDAATTALELSSKLNFRIHIRHNMEHPEELCRVCPPGVVARYPHGNPWEDPSANLLLPTIWDYDSLMRRKATVLLTPGQGESFWSMQYQCVYRSVAAERFKREWFRQTTFPKFFSPVRRAVVLDSATKDFQKLGVGDYTVCFFVEFTESGLALLVWGFRSNSLTKGGLIHEIVDWCRVNNWWPDVVGKEKFGSETLLADVVDGLNKGGASCYAQTVSRPPEARGKADFILQSNQAPLERGEVVFGSSFPPELLERLILEHIELGATAYDDCADALAVVLSPEIKIRVGIKDDGQPWPDLPLQLYTPKITNPSQGLDHFDLPEAGEEEFWVELGEWQIE